MTGPEKEAFAILAPFLGQELASDIITHRKSIKHPLTASGARSLIKEYQKTGHMVEAAEYHLNMGWRGFEASWFKRPANVSQPSLLRPGDMAAYTRELMDSYNGNTGMAASGNRADEFALEYAPAEKRH